MLYNRLSPSLNTRNFGIDITIIQIIITITIMAIMVVCSEHREVSATRFKESQPFPSNQYIYSLARDLVKQQEKLFEGRNYSLNEDERIADNYLQYLKWREMEDTAESGFPPSRPTEQVLTRIKSTAIYAALKKLPKGAILHTHENHQVSKRKLLEMAFDKTNGVYDQIHIQDPDNSEHHPWQLNLFDSWNLPPKDGGHHWIKISDYPDDPRFTIEKLTSSQRYIDALLNDSAFSLRTATNSAKRWHLANKIFNRGSSNLVGHAVLKPLYLRAMYEQGLEEGVVYFETRKSLTNMGRDIAMTEELVERFKVENPRFIGHRRIYYGKRTDSEDRIRRDLITVAENRKIYPRHVIGYDIVGDEDYGTVIAQHLDSFLAVRDAETGWNSVPLYLHAAETNWLDDISSAEHSSPSFFSSSSDDENDHHHHHHHQQKQQQQLSPNNGHHPFRKDPIPVVDNLYASLLLGSKRIGHGLGFAYKPYLMRQLKQRRIPVEVCPASNQLLGYVSDLRTHPGQILHKNGVPIIISPDDPGLFGYDEVTVDWYQVYMAWAVNLGDLKQFALNSLIYSGLDEIEKKNAIQKVWTPMWKEYINHLVQLACSTTTATTDTEAEEMRLDRKLAKFLKLLPRFAPMKTSSDVNVLGFNFEGAICKRITCRFGRFSVTTGRYITNQHIICPTPAVIMREKGEEEEESSRVGIHIGRRDGDDWSLASQTIVALTVGWNKQIFETGLNLTFVKDEYLRLEHDHAYLKRFGFNEFLSDRTISLAITTSYSQSLCSYCYCSIVLIIFRVLLFF